MEWTGWNVLLEGRKQWTFFPPLAELDAHPGTYRVTPNAFGSYNISAGWQSNTDLYRRGVTNDDGTIRPSWPSDAGSELVLQHAINGVQEEGELVLIPPRHWHQVKHVKGGPPRCCYT